MVRISSRNRRTLGTLGLGDEGTRGTGARSPSRPPSPVSLPVPLSERLPHHDQLTRDLRTLVVGKRPQSALCVTESAIERRQLRAEIHDVDFHLRATCGAAVRLGRGHELCAEALALAGPG